MRMARSFLSLLLVMVTLLTNVLPIIGAAESEEIVSGVVINYETNEPVVGAEVYYSAWDNLYDEETVVTNSKGEFTFSNNANGYNGFIRVVDTTDYTSADVVPVNSPQTDLELYVYPGTKQIAFLLNDTGENEQKLQNGDTAIGYVFDAIIGGEKVCLVYDEMDDTAQMVYAANGGPVAVSLISRRVGISESGNAVHKAYDATIISPISYGAAAYYIEGTTLEWNDGTEARPDWSCLQLASNAKIWAASDLGTDATCVSMNDFNAFCEEHGGIKAGWLWAVDVGHDGMYEYLYVRVNNEITDGSYDEPDTTSGGWVGYLNGWDKENKKAYFDDDVLGIDVPDYLTAEIESFVGKYVYVESETNPENFLDREIVNIKAVSASKCDLITSVDESEDILNPDGAITVGGVEYVVHEYVHQGMVGLPVLYHLDENGTLLDFEILEERTGVIEQIIANPLTLIISGKEYLGSHITDLSFMGTGEVLLGKIVNYYVDDAGFLISLTRQVTEYTETKLLKNYDAATQIAYFADGSSYPYCEEVEWNKDTLDALVGKWAVCKFRDVPDDCTYLIRISYPADTTDSFYKVYKGYDSETNSVHFVDGTIINMAPNWDFVGIEENAWVKCTTRENLNKDSLLINIEQVMPIIEMSVQIIGGKEFVYKDGKIGHAEESLKDKTSFRIPYEVVIKNTTSVPGHSSEELWCDQYLNINIEKVTTNAPSGFDRWFNGGKIEADNIVIRPGEQWTATGYLCVETFYEPEGISNEYEIGVCAVTDLGDGQEYETDVFTVKSLESGVSHAESPAEELEKIDGQCDITMWEFGIDAKAERQIESALLCAVVMSCAPSERFGEVLDKKVLDTLFPGRNTGLTSGSYDVSVEMAMDTEKYGELIFEFIVTVNTFGFEKSDYALWGAITCEVIGGRGAKKVNPVYRGRRTVGQIAKVDVEAFAEGAYALAEEKLKSAYDDAWGNNANKVASIIFSDTVMDILEKMDKSFSEVFFKIITAPAKRGTVKCPVDIYIYNQEGELQGSIVNNVPNQISDSVEMMVDGDTKYFILWDGEYQLELVANGTGTMSVEIEEYAGMNDLLRVVAFDNLQLKPGVCYKEKVQEQLLENEYLLTNQNGEDILPDTDKLQISSIGKASYEGKGGTNNVVHVLETESDVNGTYNLFEDVNDSQWYFDAVYYAYSNDMMIGYGNNTFAPEDELTRGMIVTILYRLEGAPEVSGNAFSDVASGMYYTDAVIWAAENGIVNGYGNGVFAPDEPITREQLAAVLYRYADYIRCGTAGRNDLSGFSDAKTVSAYALTPMQWAVESGLINGVGSGILQPGGTATRAQAAMILMRLCEEVIN